MNICFVKRSRLKCKLNKEHIANGSAEDAQKGASAPNMENDNCCYTYKRRYPFICRRK